MLQELYLRKNEIRDINEILHLSQLQYLKKLSLEDNPCTNAENYRLTVLKALPNLEFLDNIRYGHFGMTAVFMLNVLSIVSLWRVTPEDIYQAEKQGRDLVWPGSEPDVAEEEINELTDDLEYTNGSLNHSSHLNHNDSHISLSNTPSSNGYPLPVQEPTYCAPQTEDPPVGSSSCSSTYQTPISNGQSNPNRNSGSHLHYGNGLNAKDTTYGNGSCKKTNMAKSNSLSDYNLYHNGKLSPVLLTNRLIVLI